MRRVIGKEADFFMAQHEILDEDGNPTGEFWDDSDGNWDKNSQTVYKEEGGRVKKQPGSYNPETGRRYPR